MESPEKVVSSAEMLIAAVKDAATRRIVVRGGLSGVPSFRLLPGMNLHGEEGAALAFAPGQDGVQLTKDNAITDLRLDADVDRRAIFNDTSMDGLGHLRLADLVVHGQVQILARDKVRSGHVEVDGLDIVAADALNMNDRPFKGKPQGYGVFVVQGAFTLWNLQADESVTLTADLKGLCAGRPGAPVLGSGIFVSGAGDTGGRLLVSRLETGAIFSDGRIPKGTPDLISGGVFTVYGTRVDVVRNTGPVTTYGVNDMVLDNWGFVDRWIAEERITSFGPSGIGFVNFGIVNDLAVNAPIETFGQGARGFNVYTGTVHTASFDRITTHGDGSVGIQISQPVGAITVHRGIETFGGTGDSLVKGVIVNLSAIALSLKPGGSAASIEVGGGITTHGKGVAPLEIQGDIGVFHVEDGLRALGGGFDKL